MLSCVNAFSGTSPSYNLSIGRIGDYYAYNGTSNSYTIEFDLVPQPVGNRTTTTEDICLGYYCLITKEVVEEGGVAPTGGAVGGGSDIVERSKQQATGARAALEELTSGLDYIWQKIVYLFTTGFKDWKKIGEVISPLNPARGWVIFLVVIYCIFILLVSLPILLKQEIGKHKDEDGKFPFVLKMGVFICTAILGFSILWFQKNVDIIKWGLIGAQISPSNPTLGWIVLGAFIYLGWLLMMSIPMMIKGELRLAKEKDETVSNKIKITMISIALFTGIIFYWLIKNIDNIDWKNLGSSISPQFPIGGWIIAGIFVYYIIWVLFTFIPDLLRKNVNIGWKDISVSLVFLILAIAWYRKNITDWTTIGYTISPTYPILGWIVCFSILYIGWIVILSFISLVKNRLKEARETNEEIDSTLKNLTLASIVLSVIIIFWAIYNIDIYKWNELGSQISPSNPTFGWILLAIFIYYIIWILFIFIPKLFKKRARGA